MPMLKVHGDNMSKDGYTPVFPVVSIVVGMESIVIGAPAIYSR